MSAKTPKSDRSVVDELADRPIRAVASLCVPPLLGGLLLSFGQYGLSVGVIFFGILLVVFVWARVYRA